MTLDWAKAEPSARRSLRPDVTDTSGALEVEGWASSPCTQPSRRNIMSCSPRLMKLPNGIRALDSYAIASSESFANSPQLGNDREHNTDDGNRLAMTDGYVHGDRETALK